MAARQSAGAALVPAQSPEQAACRYAADGVCLLPPVIDAELVRSVGEAFDRIARCEYVTGVEPLWGTGPGVGGLLKVDQPQRSDPAIMEVITDPRIARWAADVTGASWLQVFVVQLLQKPPGSATGSVGWHQDDYYWDGWCDGEAFTVWLALSDVTADSGPIRFVRGSHRWGLVPGGSFFEHDLDAIRDSLALPDGARWDEVAAVMPPGAASIHHRTIFHGSGPNTSGRPRRSLAIHMRTQNSRLNDSAASEYADHRGGIDPRPVVFG